MKVSISSLAMTTNILTSLLLTCLVSKCHSASSSQSTCQDPPPLVMKGKHFFNSKTGDYFPVKGIAYYPRPNDGINDVNNLDLYTNDYSSIWKRDIAVMQQLDINVVRIYAVEPGQNHDGFFCELKKHGIYAIVGLAASCKNCAINNLAAPDCYPEDLKARGQFIISEFSKYDNVLAFEAGNEVGLLTNSIGHPQFSAPCQKKFLRDMRAFINGCQSNGMRQIPVGVVIADADVEVNGLYYSCRGDADEFENTDWFGLNEYRACDGTVTTIDGLTGYKELLATFTNMSLPCPVVFTEMGCKDPSYPTINGYQGQRNFLEIDAVFTEEYLKEFTGTVVFEYSTELVNSKAPWPFKNESEGNFGVVYFSPEDCNDISVPCKVVKFPEFKFLQAAYKLADTVTPPKYDGRPSTTECPPNFPPLSNFTWAADDTSDMVCPYIEAVQCDCTDSSSTTSTDDSTTTDDSTATGGATSDSKGSAPSASPPSSPTSGSSGSSASSGSSPTSTGATTDGGNGSSGSKSASTSGSSSAAVESIINFSSLLVLSIVSAALVAI